MFWTQPQHKDDFNPEIETLYDKKKIKIDKNHDDDSDSVDT